MVEEKTTRCGCPGTIIPSSWGSSVVPLLDTTLWDCTGVEALVQVLWDFGEPLKNHKTILLLASARDRVL
jgi:hypothetical protein